MKLNQFIKTYKDKYDSVTLKEIASKKQLKLYHLCCKNTREQNFIFILNKKTKEVIQESVVKISKKEIKNKITEFKNEIQNIINKQKQIKKETSYVKKELYKYKIRENLRKEKEKIMKEKISDFKFNSEKEKQDLIFLYFIFTFIREHLIENKIIIKENPKNELYTLNLKKDNLQEIDKKIYYMLENIGREMWGKGIINNSVKMDIIATEQVKKYNLVLNKVKNDEVFYIIIGLYLLEMWKINVKFKKCFFDIDKEIFENYFDFIQNYLSNVNQNVVKNSIKIAIGIFEEVYNKVPLRTMMKRKINFN